MFWPQRACKLGDKCEFLHRKKLAKPAAPAGPQADPKGKAKAKAKGKAKAKARGQRAQAAAAAQLEQEGEDDDYDYDETLER